MEPPASSRYSSCSGSCGMLLTLMLLLLWPRLAHTAAAPAASCRDRWLEPFSSESIWNTAVGSGAVFKHAQLFQPGDRRGNPANFHNDQDFILRTSVDDPVTEWINQGVWGAVKGGNCAIQNLSRSGQPCSDVGNVVDGQVTLGCPGPGCVDGCVAHIRLPARWTSASDCDGPPLSDGSNCRSKGDQANNNAMAVLLPDNETIVQMQPAYRCGYGSPLLARWGASTDGGPQNFPNETSIFGGGTFGAHGGSGLSSIGGSIRLGELLPGSPPIRHALKIELGNWYARDAFSP